MSDIMTKCSDNILTIQLSRPSRNNALTSRMYIALADLFSDAGKDDSIRAVLLHGTGESFCAGDDAEDFFENPPSRANFPGGRLLKALFEFGKPIVAAVHGEVIGAGITLLTQCDIVCAAESAKFQIAFPNLALVSKFKSGWSIPSRIGHLEVVGLKLLGPSFNASRALGMGLVTRLVSDQDLLSAAKETARELAEDPFVAIYGRKRFAKHLFRDQYDVALRVRSERTIQRVSYEDITNAVATLHERPRIGSCEIKDLAIVA